MANNGDGTYGTDTYGGGGPFVNHVVIGSLEGYSKYYDEQFDTAQEYKDSWVIPMAESQDVTYTKVVPIPPTGDPYWGAYTSEWLTVN